MEEKLAMTTILTGDSLAAHKSIDSRLAYGESMANVVRQLLVDHNKTEEAKIKKGA